MKLIPILALGAIVSAAPVDQKSSASISVPSGAITNYPHSFGIQIVAQPTATSSSANKKRDGVAQIGDGQVQVQTTISLLTPPPPPPAPTTAPIINQIGDGQIQNQKTANQIVSMVNQIGDGQIQNQKSVTQTLATSSVINQIGDGQIQNQPTAAPVSQISDGQPQASGAVSQINDGQPQASGSVSGLPLIAKACIAPNNLAMTLKDSVLNDSHGRIGAIVANRQFQFDGPPVQAGTIYSDGWYITPQGYLGRGNSDLFYQCLSGDFYNLYDQSIGGQCQPVKFGIIDLVKC